jgi:hypothetical protein
MTGNERTQRETLRLWHCPRCGYANAAANPCKGCHKPAPRVVKSNTKAHPRVEPQTALSAELLGEERPAS